MRIKNKIWGFLALLFVGCILVFFFGFFGKNDTIIRALPKKTENIFTVEVQETLPQTYNQLLFYQLSLKPIEPYT